MLKQLEADGSVHLVLTKQELVDAQHIVEAAMGAEEIGLTRFMSGEVAVMRDLVMAAYQLPDAEIVELLMAPHADHKNDNKEAMLEEFTERVATGRARAIEAGYLAG